jgi:hypothetical protein
VVRRSVYINQGPADRQVPQFLKASKYRDIPSPRVINMKRGSTGRLEVAASLPDHLDVFWLHALGISYDSEELQGFKSRTGLIYIVPTEASSLIHVASVV